MRRMQRMGLGCLGLVGLTLLVGCQSVPRFGDRPVVSGDVGAFSAVGPVGSRTTAGADYRIGTPDRVTVRCDRVRGLDVEDAVVESDGSVSLPTLGRVKVSGLTASEASDALTRRVRLVDPGATMSLTVSRFASRHVYAFGAVGSRGPVAWRPGLRLVDVLSSSGVSSDADLGEVSVIRPGLPGREGSGPRRVTVDFSRLTEAGMRR